MSLFIRGESIDDRPTHSEGIIQDDNSQLVTDHWRDTVTKHQSLRVRFLNIQNFPQNVMYHKNGDVVQLVNDNNLR